MTVGADKSVCQKIGCEHYEVNVFMSVCKMIDKKVDKPNIPNGSLYFGIPHKCPHRILHILASKNTAKDK